MEGIGLDNMLGAEEVDKLFSEQAEPAEETAELEGKDENQPKENNETEETAEVDFSDLLGNVSESVGSEENTKGNGETPESNNDSGTPQTNLFSSIAKALRDEGVFPDLSDDSLGKVTDAATLRQMFDDEVSKALDERQRRIEKALNGGAAPEEVQVYQQALNVAQFLDRKDTYETLTAEGEDGEKLRKQVMYQDYVNRGFKHEKAVKMVEKSLDDGTDIEDAKEAYESCKEFYKEQIDSYQKELEEITNQYRIRKLTPLCCWRLMGFTDEDFLSAKVGDRENARQLITEYEPDRHLEMMQYAERKDVSKMSNTQLYKQAGNSIVVDVLYHIYKNLYEAMPYLFDNLKLSSFFSGIGAFESGLNRIYADINNQTV